MSRYPHAPGVRANSTGDTAEAAAERIRPVAASYERMVLNLVRERPMTPDEAHSIIQAELKKRVPLYSIRPRFSTLKAQGLICDTGQRRAPPGGCRSIVWRACTADEIATFRAQRATIRANLGGVQ